MNACALIPAYNEADHIADVVAGCSEHVPMIVVDDGSADDTAQIARDAGAQVFVREQNAGKGVTLQEGFGHALAAGYDTAITLDGDGQHDPAEIPKFLDAAEADPALDMIVGCRMQDTSDMPALRVWTNRVMSAVVSRLCGQRVLDTQCGYRLVRLSMVGKLSLHATHYDIESEMLVQACRSGFRAAEIPVRTIYGDETSKIKVARETLNFLRLVWRHARAGRKA